MAVDKKSLIQNALYCYEDEKWDDVELDYDEDQDHELDHYYDHHHHETETTLTNDKNDPIRSSPIFSVPLIAEHQDDDVELVSLLTKEKEIETSFYLSFDPVSSSRKEAVNRILRVNARHGFSASTVILAVNYLDRFLYSFSSTTFEKMKPSWMLQLVAVTCLSLAAKVEETCVPLLLDLQGGSDQYVFEAKTIQRMELLILSTLKWRMNPVTPLSFLDHIVRRLGSLTLKSTCSNYDAHSYWDYNFLNSRCESLFLSLISDSRFLRYLPSALATATMLHVIHRQVEPLNTTHYENQLLCVLKIRKEEVDDCYDLISDALSKSVDNTNDPLKRRRFYQVIANSPNGVVLEHASLSSDSCYNSNNDSWEVVGSCISSSNSSSAHDHQSLFKRRRVLQEQQMMN